MFYMNDFVGQWLALLPDAKMVLDLCAQENFTRHLFFELFLRVSCKNFLTALIFVHY